MSPRKLTCEKYLALCREGYTATEIAKATGVTIPTVYLRARETGVYPPTKRKPVVRKLWRDPQFRERIVARIREGVRRRFQTLWEERKAILQRYLELNGPTFYRRVVEETGFMPYAVRKLIRKYEIFCLARISIGRARGGCKFSAHELFGELSTPSRRLLLYLKGDPRLPEFVASYLDPPRTRGRMRALTVHLKRIFDEETAEEIMRILRQKRWTGH